MKRIINLFVILIVLFLSQNCREKDNDDLDEIPPDNDTVVTHELYYATKFFNDTISNFKDSIVIYHIDSVNIIRDTILVFSDTIVSDTIIAEDTKNQCFFQSTRYIIGETSPFEPYGTVNNTVTECEDNFAYLLAISSPGRTTYGALVPAEVSLIDMDVSVYYIHITSKILNTSPQLYLGEVRLKF